MDKKFKNQRALPISALREVKDKTCFLMPANTCHFHCVLLWKQTKKFLYVTHTYTSTLVVFNLLN